MDGSGESDRGAGPTAPPIDASARYAAVVAALLDARPAPASARFDAELDAALDEHRIDPGTARTLRWWQRTAVREAESYASHTLPGVLAARDEADAAAARDCAAAEASWQQARELTVGTLRREPQPTPEPATEPVPAPQPQPRPPAEHGVHDIAAVRAALRLVDAPVAEPATDLVDLTTTTVATPAPVHRFTRPAPEGKDRSHAYPATSA